MSKEKPKVKSSKQEETGNKQDMHDTTKKIKNK